ncbi:MAG: T9SS type A sorting domain-containing protein [Bacteroidetes bacterium]|nr:T9SS type A sorting domain-containing protein [Bacteroidota bacterium]
MRTFILILLCLGVLLAFSQKTTIQSIKTPKPVAFTKTPPLTLISPYVEKEVLSKPMDEPHEMQPLSVYPIEGSTDPAMQQESGTLSAPPIITNFPGLGPMDNTCTNPDTEGDVGPNHYMQMVKRSFAIWDKQGNLLYGPENNKTLWSTLPGPWMDHWFTDPIVMYDHLTDRWFASNMVYEMQPDYLFWEVIAVSATPDPLGEWYCWAYEFDYMPDYPKFGVWNEEYVMTINNADVAQVGAPFMGAGIWAFNKADLLSGDPEPAVIAYTLETVNNDFYLSHSSLLPADLDGPPPPAGTPNFLMEVKDDAWGFDSDFMTLWELYTDWENPANSNFVEVGTMDVLPFNTNIVNYAFITQPNTATGLHTMANRLMFRLQYRHFDGYDVMTTNHTVTPDDPEHAGIRWYELRNIGNGWDIFQQGTYVPDQHHRWMGSISMDNRGNMALGYSVSSGEIYPSIRMTGRYDTDPLNMMGMEEIEVITGSGSQIQNNRWGDYSCMSIDPVDDQTFWYTQMYMPATGTMEWETQICSFKMAKELTIYPDTLLFDSIQECLEGKAFVIKNNSWDAIEINYIEQEGYNMNTMWYIENMPVTLPYMLPVGDSLIILVKIDFTVQSNPMGYIYDQLDITANGTYDYGVVIALNEDFLTGENKEKSIVTNIKITPNPFHSEAIISFELNEAALVNMEIIDAKERFITTLVEKQKLNSGAYTFIWNVNDGIGIASGIYYCKLSINDKVQTKKIILIK